METKSAKKPGRAKRVLSAGEARVVDRITAALAADNSGMLLKTVRAHLDFWELGAPVGYRKAYSAK
jgi:hypothetical protein